MKLLLIVPVIILAIAPRAYALPPDCMNPAFLGPDHYVQPNQIDLIDLLGPPPSPDSAQGKKDLQAVVEAQGSRTAAEIAQAKADNCFSIFAFSGVIGAGFEPSRLPFTVVFFHRVFDDGMHGVAGAKKYFNRPRPFVAEKEITTVVPQPANASYPSGHATFAYMTAILLAEMVPEKADAIFERAADFAHNRVIAGVHYPTDVAAGRVSAAVIDNLLLHDSAFETDLARSRAEVRQALGLPSK
jgi:acid phosphatase (class A)